jgi:putative flippase GtrA
MKAVNKFLTVEFIKFIIIGVINTLSTAVIATVLDKLSALAPIDKAVLEKSNATFIIAYILSMTISFFLNTYFTFREKPTLKKAVKFPVSYIPNFLVQYAVVHLLGSGTLSYIIAAVIGIPVTFITMRVFVYRKK